VLLTLTPSVSLADEGLLWAAPHIHLADTGGGIGAALDLALAGAWVPVPQVAVGLEAALLVPLRVGDRASPTDLALRATPAVWLRFGEDRRWGHVKLGCGVDSHLRGGEMKPAFVLVGAAGFTVAPPELAFFFGFELTGEVDIVGEAVTRAVGLGGYIGYRFR
jgi:hypothetical protein